jgi:hypothetical protein
MGTYKEHCSFFVLRVKRRQWVSLGSDPEVKSLVNAGGFHPVDSRWTEACVYTLAMAAGVKDYIAALSNEVVPSLLRGIGVMKVVVFALAIVAPALVGWRYDLSANMTLALVAGFIALEVILYVPYKLWARLTDQVTPRFILSCSNDEPGCVRSNVKFNTASGGSLVATWFLLKVRAHGTTNIVGCCAHLTSVKRSGKGENLLEDHSVVRPFTPATGSDAEKKTIRPTHPEYVDVITANASNGIMWLYQTHRDAAINWRSMFANAGKFNLTVALTSENSAPCVAELEFDWTGDPADSSLSLISQNPPL